MRSEVQNGGTPTKNHQFPICDTEDEFRKKVKQQLRGLTRPDPGVTRTVGCTAISRVVRDGVDSLDRMREVGALVPHRATASA
jgi:hypothetical protein